MSKRRNRIHPAVALAPPTTRASLFIGTPAYSGVSTNYAVRRATLQMPRRRFSARSYSIASPWERPSQLATRRTRN